MPSDPAVEIKRLQRCINDLVSVTALPATWVGAETSQIVTSLVDALHRVLDPDFVYMRFVDRVAGTQVESLRPASNRNHLAAGIAALMLQVGNDPPQWQARSLQMQVGGDVAIAAAPLGLHGDLGFVLAGSRRADFPGRTERLLLDVAANLAVVGLQEAHLLNAHKLAASALDERVVQRTAELAEANRALTAEVAERGRAQEALSVSEIELRRAHAQLAEAQRLSKTGSFTWDVLKDEHDWSEEIRRTFGFDQADKVTTDMIRAAIHPGDAAEVERAISGAAEGRNFDLVFRIVTRAGELRHVRVVGDRVEHIADRPVFIGALQDVTESTLAEEALERARRELAHVSRITALSALTASIAHEVNQPLAGIVTNAGACVRMLGAEQPDIASALATARRTIRDANRAADVIKQLRALFSRKPLASELVDLNDAAREILTLSSSELQNARVILHSDLLDGLPPVLGDRVQLQQVMSNLVLNAAQAMQAVDDRPHDLWISTSEDRGQVLLAVRDFGAGADTGQLSQLFNAFYTTKPDGMGVGLAVSRSIIEAHGGRLWASPNDGPGLTFTFSVPIKPDAQATT